MGISTSLNTSLYTQKVKLQLCKPTRSGSFGMHVKASQPEVVQLRLGPPAQSQHRVTLLQGTSDSCFRPSDLTDVQYES